MPSLAGAIEVAMALLYLGGLVNTDLLVTTDGGRTWAQMVELIEVWPDGIRPGATPPTLA